VEEASQREVEFLEQWSERQMEVRQGAGVVVQVREELPPAATTCGGLGKAGTIHQQVRLSNPIQA